jgi:xylulokinase
MDAVVEPRPSAAAAYAELRSVYERIYSQTRDLLHDLHDLSLGDHR